MGFFFMLIIRELLKKGWSGKVILMSATLNRLLTSYFPEYAVGVNRPYPVKEVCIDEIQTLEGSPLPWQVSAKHRLNQIQDRLPFKTSGIETQVYRFVAHYVLAFGRVGMSTLVIVPRLVDILSEIARENDVCSIDIFVLHSQIPLEEQGKAFVTPTFDETHVILATNLAESSVTIPDLVLVINTDLQQ